MDEKLGSEENEQEKAQVPILGISDVRFPSLGQVGKLKFLSIKQKHSQEQSGKCNARVWLQ